MSPLLEVPTIPRLDGSRVSNIGVDQADRSPGWWIPALNAAGAIAFLKWTTLDDGFGVEWEATNDPAALAHPNPADPDYPDAEFGEDVIQGVGLYANSHFVGYQAHLVDASDVSVLRSGTFPQAHLLCPFLAVRPVIVGTDNNLVNGISVIAVPFVPGRTAFNPTQNVNHFSCGAPASYADESILLPWVDVHDSSNFTLVMRCSASSPGATVAFQPVLTTAERDRYYNSATNDLPTTYGWTHSNVSAVASGYDADRHQGGASIYALGAVALPMPFPLGAYKVTFTSSFDDVEFDYYITR